MNHVIDFAFPLLTQQTQALQPGTITLIDGDPGACKTFFVFQNLIHMHERGIPVALLTLDGSVKSWCHMAIVIRAQDARLYDPIWILENHEEAIDIYQKHSAWADNFSFCISSLPPETTIGEISQWIAARAEEDLNVIAILGDQKDKYLSARPFMIAAHQAIEEKAALIVDARHTLSCDFERAAQTILHLQSTARTPAMPFNRILHMHKTRCGHGHGQKIAYNFCGASLTFQEVGPLETSVNITAQ